MSYIFKGSLCGRLCDDCEEYLSNVVVKLYRIRERERETVLATANPKNTFSILSEKDIKAKEKLLIAQTETGERGQFNFELGENQDYEGEAFEIDVYVERAPGQDERPDDTSPVQFTITTLQPQWRQTKEGQIAAWEYCISHRFWCRIRELLGAYVICGQVLDCEKEIPLPGVKVSAFDRDWLQDDPLGSALTDSTGHFRIYYSADDFKQGTFIDVELFGGPDIYFHVETTLGSPLLIEDPSKGRDPDRENAGSCFCVTLCLADTPSIPPPEPLPFFSHIGGYDYEDDIVSATGLTVGADRAFFSNLRLNGTLSKKFNGSDLEYRFEVHETDPSGNLLGGESWEPVLEAQMGKQKIGTLQRSNPDYPVPSPNPIENVDYVIKPNQPDELAVNIVNDSGVDWIQVPQEADNPLDSTGDGFFTPNHNLISLNSRSIASFPDVDLTGLVTGNSVTDVHPLVENKHFAIRMIVREKGSPGTEEVAGTCDHISVNNTLYDGIDSHPDWYSNIRNNQLAVAMVDVAQLQGHGCLGITTDLDVVFTAAHPNLGSVSLNMTGPGGPYNFTMPPVSSPGDHHGTATPDFSVSDLEPCAYIVNMSVQVLLTDGDDTPSNRHDEIAFCKRNGNT
ncbi:hypothetical protein [Fodinibius salsisoli]|uniref:Carboxypeptidase regulatory-like domain-containing protein n=1 Tax=Fodinibius salsisoli TaxID=2820877 RepID=A0ABT3PTA6_9BACT|nr:hypothetical protein [Fodinibius salsisoli]MCW9709093.1 hypothetical protein [Fodinibius salsisoli]